MSEAQSRDADSMNVVLERIRGLSDGFRDLKESIRDLEARVRQVETEEMEIIRRQMCELEARAKSFESTHDNHKEKWNMVLNFVVQLMWVLTASFVLTKLGLGTGPL